MSLKVTWQILFLPLPGRLLCPSPIRWVIIPSGFGGNSLRHTSKPQHQRSHIPGSVTKVKTSNKEECLSLM